MLSGHGAAFTISRLRALSARYATLADGTGGSLPAFELLGSTPKITRKHPVESTRCRLMPTRPAWTDLPGRQRQPAIFADNALRSGSVSTIPTKRAENVLPVRDGIIDRRDLRSLTLVFHDMFDFAPRLQANRQAQGAIMLK